MAPIGLVPNCLLDGPMMPTDLRPIILTNRTRLLSPALTFALCSIMFGPLAAVAVANKSATAKTLTGTVVFVICVLMCLVSAWRAPYALTIGSDLRVRRLSRERRYAFSAVQKWFFSVPDAMPTCEAPGTNALLQLTLKDGTRFRGEVTAAEADALVRVLPRGSKIAASI